MTVSREFESSCTRGICCRFALFCPLIDEKVREELDKQGEIVIDIRELVESSTDDLSDCKISPIVLDLAEPGSSTYEKKLISRYVDMGYWYSRKKSTLTLQLEKSYLLDDTFSYLFKKSGGCPYTKKENL